MMPGAHYRLRGLRRLLRDGTHAVVCMACRLPLYRGLKLAAAERIFANHLCEPVVPLGRRRRR
jgi:hypothetical protein